METGEGPVGHRHPLGAVVQWRGAGSSLRVTDEQQQGSEARLNGAPAVGFPAGGEKAQPSLWGWVRATSWGAGGEVGIRGEGSRRKEQVQVGSERQ